MVGAWLDGMVEILVSVEFTTSEYCEYVLYRMYYRYHTERREHHGYTDSHFGQCHGGVFSPYANMYYAKAFEETTIRRPFPAERILQDT
jgi:hypothetical protein